MSSEQAEYKSYDSAGNKYGELQPQKPPLNNQLESVEVGLYCPACNRLHPNGNAGTKLSFCSNCGHMTKPFGRHCRECGSTKVTGQTTLASFKTIVAAELESYFGPGKHVEFMAQVINEHHLTYAGIIAQAEARAELRGRIDELKRALNGEFVCLLVEPLQYRLAELEKEL